jgi:hypothetical protein
MNSTETLDVTPRLALHLTRLQELQNDLTRNMNKLVKRLDKNSDEDNCLVLIPALHNIVDRQKDKERHRKKWKIQLHDIISSAIEFETL